jgi:hypothetical protein
MTETGKARTGVSLQKSRNVDSKGGKPRQLPKSLQQALRALKAPPRLPFGASVHASLVPGPTAAVLRDMPCPHGKWRSRCKLCCGLCEHGNQKKRGCVQCGTGVCPVHPKVLRDLCSRCRNARRQKKKATEPKFPRAAGAAAMSSVDAQALLAETSVASAGMETSGASAGMQETMATTCSSPRSLEKAILQKMAKLKAESKTALQTGGQGSRRQSASTTSAAASYDPQIAHEIIRELASKL